LEADWCVDHVDLFGSKVVFEKMKPGGRASVDFFNTILDELRTVAVFDTREVSPTGRNWLTLAYVRCNSSFSASLALMFDRDEGFGMEWRLHPGPERVEEVFQLLLEQKAEIEGELGECPSWRPEHIGEQRTWKISMYYGDSMPDDEQLKSWVMEKVNTFYNAFAARLCAAQDSLQTP
jgi:hypothetical protein